MFHHNKVTIGHGVSKHLLNYAITGLHDVPLDIYIQRTSSLEELVYLTSCTLQTASFPQHLLPNYTLFLHVDYISTAQGAMNIYNKICISQT